MPNDPITAAVRSVLPFAGPKLAASLSAALRPIHGEEAASRRRVVDLGAGKYAISTGTFYDVPAVFIEDAPSPGPIGVTVPREEREKLGLSAEKAIVITHDDERRVQAIANIMCGDSLEAALSVPHQDAPASPPPVPEPVCKAVERILDEESAWVARPNDTVTKRIALAATIAAMMVIEKDRGDALTSSQPAEVREVVNIAGDRADTLAHEILGAHCACYAEAWPAHTCANECDAVAAQIRAAGYLTTPVVAGQTVGPVIPPLGEDGYSSATGYPYPELGMSLRDYFAGQALGWMARAEGQRGDAARLAHDAYTVADAMLLARREPTE